MVVVLQGLCIHLFGLDLHLCVLLDGLKGLHSERHVLDLDNHFVFSSQLSLLPDGVHTLPQLLGLVGVVGCREGLLEHVGFHPVLERTSFFQINFLFVIVGKKLSVPTYLA